MGLKVKNTNIDFELPPAETTLAVCIHVVDLGLQKGSYQGQPRVDAQYLFTWELPRQKMKDGRPFTLSNHYTASLGKKANLRKMIEAWGGRELTEKELEEGFDLKKLLGRWCMLGIVHNDHKDKTYANINSIVKLPPDMVPIIKTIDIFNPLVFFDLEDAESSREKNYNLLPEWIRKKIDNRVEPEDEEFDIDEDSIFPEDDDGINPPPPDDDEIPF